MWPPSYTYFAHILKRKHTKPKFADAPPLPPPPPPSSLGLSADALAVVLSFSDLGGVAATSATSTEFRDGMRALCPALQHELVVRTVFPILSTLDWRGRARPPPRELYLSQARLYLRQEVPAVAPTVGLDAYVFSLELAARHASPGRAPLFVGTGAVDAASTEADVTWTIPAGLWELANETYDHGTRARVMATRRETFERALLYEGIIDDWDGTTLFFECSAIPHGRDHDFLNWIHHSPAPNNVYHVPHGLVLWDAPGARDASAESPAATTLTMRFAWESEDETSEMTVDQARLVLEHWATFAA